jgi:hypothetical protein
MKRYKFGNLTFAAAMAVVLFSTPGAKAQSAASSAATVSATNQVFPARIYNVSKEIKVQGTIQSIQASTSGVLSGTHVQIETTNGVVDAHLSVTPNVNAKTLDLSTGETIEVTGMMATEGGSNVLLARILTTPSRIFILRNERGVPIRAVPSRATSAAAKTAKGGL